GSPAVRTHSDRPYSLYRVQEMSQQGPRRMLPGRLPVGRHRDAGYSRSRERGWGDGLLRSEKKRCSHAAPLLWTGVEPESQTTAEWSPAAEWPFPSKRPARGGDQESQADLAHRHGSRADHPTGRQDKVHAALPTPA